MSSGDIEAIVVGNSMAGKPRCVPEARCVVGHCSRNERGSGEKQETFQGRIKGWQHRQGMLTWRKKVQSAKEIEN